MIDSQAIPVTGQRLQALRAQMAERRLGALVVPRADQYLGEYLPPHHERLRWLSGFTGSAGMLLVLPDRAAIFVDGRYTVQVRQQVDSGWIEIHSLTEQPPMAWLSRQANLSGRVGFDPRMHSFSWRQSTEGVLEKAGLELVELEENLVDLCWRDRPRPAPRQAFLLGQEYSGKDSAAKRAEIGEQIVQRGADAAYLFAADSCNWLLNIRGADVPNLPIILGSAILHGNGEMLFFSDPDKIPDGFAAHVGRGVSVRPEAELPLAFRQLRGKTILSDPDTANAWSQLALQRAGALVLAGADPAILPKACKNRVEVQGMRNAHVRDGAAVVKFLAWLDAEVHAGRLPDEASAAEHLGELRAAQAGFQEPSFDTISAAAANAAMCHYNHLNGTPARLEQNNVYLVDSGGQYFDGTTDITRTVAIGEAGEEVRERFTLVLKGMIALARAHFPAGTTGTQLDVLARQFLWGWGLDYNHGTGHGVGSFLAVHEGPQRIATAPTDVALRPGMVVSDEPGYYKDDCYGIRCENLVVVTEVGSMQDSGKQLLGFETLTMAPFDRRLLLRELLTVDEQRWLDDYHAQVLERVGPLLEGADLAWLKQATRPL